MSEIIKIAFSLAPVIIFLGIMVFLDSFKLIRLSRIFVTIIIGCIVSLLCMFINTWLIDILNLKVLLYTRYAAPAVEEFFKCLFIVYLLKANKVGFLVDSAIYGFAIGTGFALVENIYYLNTVENPSMLLWILRGFGTAVMHGGTTAVFALISKNTMERKDSHKLAIFIPGLLLAVFIHSFFNHFVLPPEFMTLVNLIIISALLLFIYDKSEKKTRLWLELGFDADIQILEMIKSGEITDTHIGKYLESIKNNFPGKVVADILCYLDIYLQLALRAKGVLMMKEAGIKVEQDAEINELQAELRYLENSIGATGKLAIKPLLHISSRDLWQITIFPKK